MSKKKSFSGSTMTLKDFHGGSIPSDISLPSAPGVIARPADRPGYDRQTAWANPTGRSDQRLRPNSSGSVRNLDDKTPFINNAAHIGRNFDEDERKPLDGPSVPRRTVFDESICGSSYSARVVEGDHLSASYCSSSGNGGGSGLYPNAWGVRKEAAMVTEMVSKFAQVSALDQISSGRWKAKLMHHQADIEVIRESESPNSCYRRVNDSYSGVNSSEREYYENTLVRHVERGLAMEEGIRGGVREMPGVERVSSPVLEIGNERSTVLYTNDGQPAYPDGKYGGSELQLPPEVSERPKLKLLPRTRPLDIPEPSFVDYKQVSQQLADTSHIATGGNLYHVKPGLNVNEAGHVTPAPSSSEAGNRLVERPKLNLKPRSQPLNQSKGSIEIERMALFGGAPPREMVLKGRGDDVVNNHDIVQAPSRIKSDIHRPEIASSHANISRHSEKMENLPTDHGTGMQRKNRRNSRITEKHQQQKRQPSPETWRKPVELPKPANSDSSVLRFGKAVSSVELAQAFSRSVSEPKSVNQFSGQRGLAGHNQIPFSRLTGSETRAQINGY